MLREDWCDRRAQPPAGSIPAHRAIRTGHGEGDSRRRGFTQEYADTDGTRACLAPGFPHRRNPASPGKAMPPVHRVGAGVRRLRPLRRRALSTWRPPGVAMRMRKPCVLRR
jgi:hypothetical protein